MANRRDQIEKLRRLAESPNPHEAQLAREEADRLAKGLPDLVAAPLQDPAYPYQLPGMIRIPTPIGDDR